MNIFEMEDFTQISITLSTLSLPHFIPTCPLTIFTFQMIYFLPQRYLERYCKFEDIGIIIPEESQLSSSH